jgi:GTPase Era involved in 16S rRNA processing
MSKNPVTPPSFTIRSYRPKVPSDEVNEMLKTPSPSTPATPNTDDVFDKPESPTVTNNGQYNKPAVPAKPKRSVSLSERSKPTTRSSDLNKVLQMIQTIDYDKPQRVGLMAIATQVGSSSNLTTQDWQELWKNENFCKFIGHCVERGVAIQQIKVIMENNEENKQSIPPTLLRKLYLVTLPLKFDTTEEFHLACESIITRGAVPEDFMKVLILSCKRNEMFCRTLGDANALIYWNPASNTFTRDWDMLAVHTAFKNLAEYFDKLYLVTLPSKFHSTENFQSVCESIVRRGIVPDSFMKVLTISCQRNEMLLKTLKNANALIHWNPDNKTFSKEWDVQVVQTAFKRVAEFLRKLSEVNLPSKFNRIEDFQSVCERIVESSVMPDNFMKVLTLSCERNEAFRKHLKEANALTYWDSEKGMFTREWDMQIVRQILQKTAYFISQKEDTGRKLVVMDVQNQEGFNEVPDQSESLSDSFTGSVKSTIGVLNAHTDATYRKPAVIVLHEHTCVNESQNQTGQPPADIAVDGVDGVGFSFQNQPGGGRPFNTEVTSDNSLEVPTPPCDGPQMLLGISDGNDAAIHLSSDDAVCAREWDARDVQFADDNTTEHSNFRTEVLIQKQAVKTLDEQTDVNEGRISLKSSLSFTSHFDDIRLNFQKNITEKQSDSERHQQQICLDEVQQPAELPSSEASSNGCGDCVTPVAVDSRYTITVSSGKDVINRASLHVFEPPCEFSMTKEGIQPVKADAVQPSYHVVSPTIKDEALNMRGDYGTSRNVDFVTIQDTSQRGKVEAVGPSGDLSTIENMKLRERVDIVERSGEVSTISNRTEQLIVDTIAQPRNLLTANTAAQRGILDFIEPLLDIEYSSIDNGTQQAKVDTVEKPGDVELSSIGNVTQSKKADVAEAPGDFGTTRYEPQRLEVNDIKPSHDPHLSMIRGMTERMGLDTTGHQAGDFSTVRTETQLQGVDVVDLDLTQPVQSDDWDSQGHISTVDDEVQRQKTDVIEPSCDPESWMMRAVTQRLRAEILEPAGDFSTIRDGSPSITKDTIEQPRELLTAKTVTQHVMLDFIEPLRDIKYSSIDNGTQQAKVDTIEMPGDEELSSIGDVAQSKKAVVTEAPGDSSTIGHEAQYLRVNAHDSDLSTFRDVTEHANFETAGQPAAEFSTIENKAQRPGVASVNKPVDLDFSEIQDVAQHARTDVEEPCGNFSSIENEAHLSRMDIVEPSDGLDFFMAEVETQRLRVDVVDPSAKASSVEEDKHASTDALNPPDDVKFSPIRDETQYVKVSVLEPTYDFSAKNDLTQNVRVDLVDPSVEVKFSSIEDEAQYLRIDTVASQGDAEMHSTRNGTSSVEVDTVKTGGEYSTIKMESHRLREDAVDSPGDFDLSAVQDLIIQHVRADVVEPPDNFSTISHKGSRLKLNDVEQLDDLDIPTIQDEIRHMTVDVVEPTDNSSIIGDEVHHVRIATVEPPSQPDRFTTQDYTQNFSFEFVEPPASFASSSIDDGVHAASIDMKSQASVEYLTVSQPMKPTLSSSDIRRILLGNARFNIGQKEYYTVSEILPVPKVEAHNHRVTTFVAKVLPYLLQRVKMRGCRVLQATRIARLVTSDDGRENNEWNADAISPVSRLDCITCLMNFVSPAVASDILSIMAQFPMSLPLVVASFENSSRIDLTPWLCGITVKWECGRIIENSLFVDPFRLLVAVRLGKNEYGKSTILNHLFATDNVFSSKGEDGAVFGGPACLHGSVEFVFLTQETCKDTFWENSVKQFYAHGRNELILLANVHGNIADQLDTIKLLNRFSCNYLAFVMPDCDESSLTNFVRAVGSDDRVTTIRVDPGDYNPHTDIRIVQLVSNETIKKVCKVVDVALQSCEVVRDIDSLTVQIPQLANVTTAQPVSTLQSTRVVNLVRERSCKATKQSLQLKRSRGQDERSPTTQITELDEVIRLFIDVLRLPTDELNLAVIHLEKELSRLSNSESARARGEVVKLKSSLQTAGAVNPDPSEVARLQTEIRIALEEIDHMNLGFEHLLRKTAQLYTSVVTEKRSISGDGGGGDAAGILQLPRTVAQLIVEGHAVELLNGDAGDIPMPWFLAVCKSITELRPNMRVYVVSVLGLQSSGKSTLLNSLFACRFAVSVGRCSRGLFMRLLIVDEAVSKDHNFDAILLIDSEGLGSTEKINDPEAVKKDRLLATFAMSISSMTIINVLGDTAKDLAEILQIAIVTMARLKRADISPDVTMVQHLLTEKNEEKTLKMEEEVCRAIQNAIDLAERKDVQVGALNTRCWQTLLRRIQDKTLLLHFHPFKDGATVNSPPSELYHEDIIRLYTKILTSSKESKAAIDFKKWYSLVESFWEFVSADDFALHFKNTKEIYEFIDRGQRIAQVKEAFGEAFSYHAKRLKEEILIRAREDSSNASRSQMAEEIEIELDSIPDCQWNCEKCQAVRELQLMLSEFVRDQPHEQETITTIQNHQERLLEANRKRLVQTFDAAVVQYGCCAEFDDTITSYLHAYFEQKKPGEFGDEDKASIVKTIFAELRNAEIRRMAENGDAEDGTVLQKFTNELRVVYPQVQQVVPLFQTQKQLQFEDVIQYRQDDAEADVQNNGRTTGLSWDEKRKETKELKTCLADLPKAVIKQMNAECFEIGMVELMYTKVTEVLERFRFLHLSPETNMNLHAWAQQLLFAEVEALQLEWDRQNKPLSILEQNEERYEQMIYTRLEYGFTVESEGLIIAKSLAAAISSKTVAAVGYIKTLTMKGLTWARNSEKIRLEYFKGLAEEVSSGNKERALQHFKNPREAIEQWYEERVRGHYNASDVPVLYQKGYRVELQHVLNAVARASSWPELVAEVTSYTTRDNAVGYKPSINFSDDAAIDLEHVKHTIVDELTHGGGDAPPDNLPQLVLPPRNSDVMLRLGCTASCGFCGALCWGEREHDMNADDSRRHHSSHQPRGLILTGYRHTDCLVARPCHELTDDLRVWFGDFKETGMTWGEAKRNHFADWKFDRHTVREFDELMRWFFQELHVDIAASVDNRNPATDEDLRKYQCKGLQLPAIIHRMEHEIK